MSNKHYFFKFKERNTGFIKLLESKDYNKHKVPLPIYFGTWTVDRYREDKENIDFGNPYQRGHRKKQVETFFSLENFDREIYFWIFLYDKVYPIKLNKPYKIFQVLENHPDYSIVSDSSGSTPKCYYGSILDETKIAKTHFKGYYPKESLPECFAHINSNQKYNRKTIVELTGIEQEIAESLIAADENKLLIAKDRVLEYLSPVQFETLIFLIFVEKNIYCSTYRGGTKEKFDLKIFNDKKVFPEFKKNGNINIQIKMKTDFKPEKSDKQTIFISLGESNEEINLFGKDWILSNIQESRYINEWLKKSLEYFKIEN